VQFASQTTSGNRKLAVGLKNCLPMRGIQNKATAIQIIIIIIIIIIKKTLRKTAVS